MLGYTPVTEEQGGLGVSGHWMQEDHSGALLAECFQDCFFLLPLAT